MNTTDVQAIPAPGHPYDGQDGWLEDILSTSKTGFLIIDADLRLKYANRAVRAMVNAGPADSGDALLELLELRQPNIERIFRSVGYGGSWEGLYAHDGKILNIQVRLLAREQAEHPAADTFYLVEVRDNTREVVELQKLSEQNVQVRETEKIRSEFIDQISHEFKTPLNAILGYCEHIREDSALPEHHRDDLLEVITASRKLLGAINDMLDASRSRDKKINLVLEPVELDKLFAECMSLLSAQAAAKNVTISHTGRGIKVLSDRIRLKQVLLNLLGNAIRFNRKGGEIRLLATELPGEFQVSVIDTGQGIRYEDQAGLLSPLARLGKAGDKFSKSGLGLMICKRLLFLLKGELKFASYPGVGSLFRFRLPLNRPQIVTPAPRALTGVKRLVWIDQADAAGDFCDALARIFPDLQCLHITAVDDLSGIDAVKNSLFVYFRQDDGIPHDGGKGEIAPEQLKDCRVLVVNQQGRIEKFDTRDEALYLRVIGREFSMPLLCQLIDGPSR